MDDEIKLNVMQQLRLAKQAALDRGQSIEQANQAAIEKLRTLRNWDTRNTNPMNARKAPSPSLVFAWANQIDAKMRQSGQASSLAEEFSYLDAKQNGRSRVTQLGTQQTFSANVATPATLPPPGSQVTNAQIHVVNPEDYQNVSGPTTPPVVPGLTPEQAALSERTRAEAKHAINARKELNNARKELAANSNKTAAASSTQATQAQQVNGIVD